MADIKMTTQEIKDFTSRSVWKTIFENSVRTPLTTQIFRSLPVGFNGTRIPLMTKPPVVSIVGEAERKPTTDFELKPVDLDKKKATCIISYSMEMLESLNSAEEQKSFIHESVEDSITDATFKKIDDYTLETIASASEQAEVEPITWSATNVYDTIISAEKALLKGGKDLNVFALDKSVMPDIHASKDANGRPLFLEYGKTAETNFMKKDFWTNRADVLGYDAFIRRNYKIPNPSGEGTILGFAGDATKGINGKVEIMTPKKIEGFKDENGVSHFCEQENLIALRYEVFFGFAVADGSSFIPFVERDTKKN